MQVETVCLDVVCTSMQISGFSIEGFHHFGPESEKFKLTDVSDLLQRTLVCCIYS